MVNKGVWDALDADTQAGIQKAADEIGASCTAKSEELSLWYYDQLEENGMSVVDAGPEFMSELEAIGTAMQAEWLEATGDDGKAIMDAYKGM